MVESVEDHTIAKSVTVGDIVEVTVIGWIVVDVSVGVVGSIVVADLATTESIGRPKVSGSAAVIIFPISSQRLALKNTIIVLLTIANVFAVEEDENDLRTWLRWRRKCFDCHCAEIRFRM